MANGQGQVDEVIGQQAIKQVDDFEKSLKALVTQMTNALNIAQQLNSATGLTTVQAGIAATNQATRASKDLTAAMALEIVERQHNNNALKTEAKEISQVVGAYANLDASHSKLAKEARDLGIQFGINSQQFKDAAKNANDFLHRLKEVDEALGNSRRNVGNYQSATYSLSQVLRELPAFTYSAQQGFLAIGNNIPILIDQFRLVRESVNSTREALLIFGRSIFSFVNIFTIASGLFTIFYKDIMNFMNGTTEAAEKLKITSESVAESLSGSVFTDAVKNVEQLSVKIQLAKDGFIDKNDVLKMYNETIGKTTGYVDTLGKAENELIKNKDAYVQMMFFKAAATEAYDRAAKSAVDEVFNKKKLEENYEGGFSKKGNWLQRMWEDLSNIAKESDTKSLQDVVAEKIGDAVSKSLSEKDTLLEIAKGLEEEAAKISKAFNFRFDPQKDGKDAREKAEKVAKEFKFHFVRALENMADDERLMGSITKETIKALGDAYEAMLPEIYKDIDDEMNRMDRNNLSTQDAATLGTQLNNRESNSQRKAREEKEHKERLERYDEWKDAIGGVINSLEGLSDAFTARELSAIDTREKRLQEYYDNERRFIEQSGFSSLQKGKMQQKLDAETEAKRKQYDRDRITAIRKAATIQKAVDIANIIASTAQAIMAALGAKPYTPANIALAAGAGLAGAAQLARVIATPLPQYARGRKGGKQEWAVVGEAGQEAIVHNGRVELTPNAPTVTLLPEGASVIPNHELIKNAAYVKLSKQGTVTTDKLQMALLNAFDREHEDNLRLQKILLDKNFSLTNKDLSGYEAYRQSKVK